MMTLQRVSELAGRNDVNNLNPNMEKAANDIEDLVEHLNTLESSGWLASEDMDEVAYYLTRIVHLVGLDIDIDRMNDNYLANLVNNAE
jgi:hypothetical protein